MSGFLDPHASSVEAEYTRYLDPDILGKIVLKNFAVNVLNLEPRRIRIPLSRQGDSGTTYKDACDAGIRFANRTYNIETKCSRWVVAMRSRATNPVPRWLFSGLLHTPTGNERSEYDLVFAVGINAPGLEDSIGYWKHLHSLKKEHESEGRSFKLSVWPHDPAFLSRCGIYILPRQAISKNHVDITIRTISQRPDFEFFSWGHDLHRLRQVWQRALEVVNESGSTRTQME